MLKLKFCVTCFSKTVARCVWMSLTVTLMLVSKLKTVAHATISPARAPRCMVSLLQVYRESCTTKQISWRKWHPVLMWSGNSEERHEYKEELEHKPHDSATCWVGLDVVSPYRRPSSSLLGKGQEVPCCNTVAGSPRGYLYHINNIFYGQ